MPAQLYGGVEGTEIVVPEEISERTDLSVEQAEGLFDLRHARDKGDAIIVLEEWATVPKYDISPTRALFAAEVEDYSEKAYFLVGAFHVDVDGLQGGFDEDDDWLTDYVTVVDETDNGAEAEGRTFLPKSAVEEIFTVEGGL